MAERVLVTGGAGFIGRGLVRALADAGHEVVVLDALVPSVHGEDPAAPDPGPGVRFVRGDVRDRRAWLDALEGVRTVHHLAAETGTGESMYRTRRYVDVNVGGTALLADLVAAGEAPDLRRVVLASSRAVYGEGPYRCPEHGRVQPEPRTLERLGAGRWEPTCPTCGRDVEAAPSRAADTPTAPTSIYGMTKRDQEEILGLVLPSRGVGSVLLRLQNVYGPGQSLRNPYTGILSIFSVRLLAGQGIRIFEDGHESRDFVYVDDVVAALVAAGGADLDADAPLVLDVGSGRAASVLEVARALCSAYGVGEDRLRVTGEFRLGDVRHAVADPGPLRERLGVTAPTALEEGLGRLAAWVRASDRPTSALDAALGEMVAAGLLRIAAGEAGGS